MNESKNPVASPPVDERTEQPSAPPPEGAAATPPQDDAPPEIGPETALYW